MLKVLPYLVFALVSGLASAAPVKIGAVYANAGFLKPLDDASWRGTQAAAAVANRSGQEVELIYAPYDSKQLFSFFVGFAR